MAEVLSARQATERPTLACSFAALPLTALQPTPAQELVIELRRGALTVKVSCLVTAASECAAWTRELLR